MALGYPYDNYGSLGLGQSMANQNQAALDYERSRREYEMMRGMQNAISAQQQMCTRVVPEEPKESPLLVLLTGE